MKLLIRTGAFLLSLLIALIAPGLFVHDVWVQRQQDGVQTSLAAVRTGRVSCAAHRRPVRLRPREVKNSLTMVMPPGNATEPGESDYEDTMPEAA